MALRVAGALDDAGVPCAIGGALALAVWSDPRATYDVDLNVFFEHAFPTHQRAGAEALAAKLAGQGLNARCAPA